MPAEKQEPMAKKEKNLKVKTFLILNNKLSELSLEIYQRTLFPYFFDMDFISESLIPENIHLSPQASTEWDIFLVTKLKKKLKNRAKKKC